MVLFQNGVRQLRSPAKMAATVRLRCYWKQLWSRWAITGSWEPLVVVPDGSIIFYFYYLICQIFFPLGTEFFFSFRFMLFQPSLFSKTNFSPLNIQKIVPIWFIKGLCTFIEPVWKLTFWSFANKNSISTCTYNWNSLKAFWTFLKFLPSFQFHNSFINFIQHF
jgi:hypothetical protein